jgi:hypothetical protein
MTPVLVIAVLVVVAAVVLDRVAEWRWRATPALRDTPDGPVVPDGAVLTGTATLGYQGDRAAARQMSTATLCQVARRLGQRFYRSGLPRADLVRLAAVRDELRARGVLLHPLGLPGRANDKVPAPIPGPTFHRGGAS